VATLAAARPVYPLYSAALGTIVLNAPGNERHRPARDALLATLRRLQLGSDNGWQPGDASFGVDEGLVERSLEPAVERVHQSDAQPRQ